MGSLRFFDAEDVHTAQIKSALAFKFRVKPEKIHVTWTGTTTTVEVDQHNTQPYRTALVRVAADMHRSKCNQARIILDVFGMSGSISDTYTGPRGGVRRCRECREQWA
jgi:ribosomal protein L23